MLFRSSGQSTGTWEEKAVTTNGKETYPFPGQARFTSPDVYKMQDFEMLDNSGGKLRDKRRESGSGSLADAYKNPKFGTTNPGTLKNDYMIINQT